jgi:hypothetical protein
MIWPMTIQSNRSKAARRSFNVGADRAWLNLLDVGRNMHALNRRELRDAIHREPIEEFRSCARTGAALMRVADLRGRIRGSDRTRE